MPQTPSLPQPSSPLHRSVSSEDLTAGSAHSGTATSETGNLPGGVRVHARTMSRSALLPRESYPEVDCPVVELRDRFGNSTSIAAFNGSNFGAALRANPALAHLPERAEDDSLGSDLAERAELARASEQTIRARRSANLPLRSAPIMRAGDAYRHPYAIDIPPGHPAFATQITSARDDFVRMNVRKFLDEAELSWLPKDWTSITCADVEDAFSNVANCFVFGWGASAAPEDPTMHEGNQDRDIHIRNDWKNGELDRLIGATFITFNNGSEWIVWFEDRTAGYHLNTEAVVDGLPSEFYRQLEKDRPTALRGLNQLFVARPVASNTLHALQNIAPEEAHEILAEHCNTTGGFITDMGFDEFGHVMQSAYPRVVVARYDTQTTDLQALGSALDAFEGRFALVKIDHDEPSALQDMIVFCFDGPGLTASLNSARASNLDQNALQAPRSGTPRFSLANRTPQQHLKFQRNSLLFNSAPSTRLSRPSSIMRRVPKANEFRLYQPFDYGGNASKYEPPSVILQQHFRDADEIGVISTGNLRP